MTAKGKEPRMGAWNHILPLAYLLTLLPAAAQGAVWFVDGRAPATASPGLGRSWEWAFRSVQEGVDAAAPGDQVWVAKGEYRENIVLTGEKGNGVALYGGFRGGEARLEQRDRKANPAVLDGKGAGSVIKIVGCPDPATRVDGFTIRNGNGDGALKGSGRAGGGVFFRNSSPVIAGNDITGNRADFGGGIGGYGPGTAVVTGNRVTGNRAYPNGQGQSWGGGVAVWGPAATITGNTISDNLCTFQGAGLGVWENTHLIARNRIEGNRGNAGIFLQWASARVAGNLVRGNRSNGIVTLGRALPTDPGDITIVNNTVVDNRGKGILLTEGEHSAVLRNNLIAFNGTGVRNETATLALGNNDFFGNREAWAGTIPPHPADLAKDPRFRDRKKGDFRLAKGSPCIDAGDNAAVAASDLDLDGRPRIIDARTGRARAGTVDIGCFEAEDATGAVKTELSR
jgi:parallel beta-helix repeat protein